MSDCRIIVVISIGPQRFIESYANDIICRMRCSFSFFAGPWKRNFAFVRVKRSGENGWTLEGVWAIFVALRWSDVKESSIIFLYLPFTSISTTTFFSDQFWGKQSQSLRDLYENEGDFIMKLNVTISIVYWSTELVF